MASYEERQVELKRKYSELIGSSSLLTVKYRDILSGKTFTTSCLAPDFYHAGLDKPNNKEKKAKVFPRIINPKHMLWLIQEHKAILDTIRIFERCSSEDLAYAELWMYHIKAYPITGIRNLNIGKDLSTLNNDYLSLPSSCQSIASGQRSEDDGIDEEDIWFNKIIYECQIWTAVGERLALINLKRNFYISFLGGWKQKIGDISNELGAKRKKISMLINSSSFERKLIRQFVENKNCLVFDWTDIVEGEEVLTSTAVKIKIFEKIQLFHKQFETKLLPYLKTITKSVNIGLDHEITRTVHQTIQSYLESLKLTSGSIEVDCCILNNNLYLKLDKIKEDLKAPIKELCQFEHVKISFEDMEDFEDIVDNLIDNDLDLRKFLRNFIIEEFHDFIVVDEIILEQENATTIEYLLYCEKLLKNLSTTTDKIVSGAFIVNMSGTWEVIEQRIKSRILFCQDNLIQTFITDTKALHQKFIHFNKLLSFRSLKPELMLLNRCEVMDVVKSQIRPAVNELCKLVTKMHDLLDVIRFNAFEQVHMIDVISLRLQFKGKLNDYEMFFQRRLHMFIFFVKNQQLSVRNATFMALDRLKVINSFSNPNETDEYLREIEELHPILVKLLETIQQLNKYETAVDFTESQFQQAKAINNHVNNLSTLFTSTKIFLEYQRAFLNRPRILANVQEAKVIVEKFCEELNNLNNNLEGHRAARHFIVQLQSDIDKFKQTFPLIEIFSNSKLKNEHLLRICNITNIEVSRIFNATVQEVIHLNLHSFLPQLKPISFIAEREGELNDKIELISDFWAVQRISMVENGFWKLSVPDNLEFIYNAAREHLIILNSFVENQSDSDISIFLEVVHNWINQLKVVYEVMHEWSLTLNRFLKLAPIIKFNIKALVKEFKEFRVVAKYFKKLENYLKNESLALKIKDGKHVKCWIELGGKHIKQLMDLFGKYTHKIRTSSIRIGLLSDGDLLLLMTEQPIEEFLFNMKRLCFYNIKDLKIKNKGKMLVVKNLDDQEIVIHKDDLDLTIYQSNTSLLDKVYLLEAAINNKLCELAERISRKSDVKMIYEEGEKNVPNISKLLYERVSKMSSSEHAFNYILNDHKHLKLLSKGDKREKSITVNFIPILNIERASKMTLNFASNWTQGKIPILRGNVYESRILLEQIQLVMFAGLHYINCHQFITEKAIEHIIGAVGKQNSIIVVLENYDQLQASVRLNLFKKFPELCGQPCPMLVLVSPISTTEETKFSNYIFIEMLHVVATRQDSNTNSSPFKGETPSGNDVGSISASSLMLDAIQTPNSLGGERRFSLFNIKKRNSIFTVHSPKSIAENLLEYLKIKDIESGRTSRIHIANVKSFRKNRSTSIYSHISNDPKNIQFNDIENNPIAGHIISGSTSLAFVGPASKSTLIELMKESSFKSRWIYLDALTSTQILHENVEFGEPPDGILLNCLKSLESPTNQTKSTFLIFYGIRNFSQHFPMIFSLLSKSITFTPDKEKASLRSNRDSMSSSSSSINSKQLEIPGSFITFPDGSNYPITSNVKFLICIPKMTLDKSDLDWITRCGIQTIAIESIVKVSLIDVWPEYYLRIQELISKVEYMEVISSTFEYIIHPLWSYVDPTYVNVNIFMDLLIEDLMEIMPGITLTNFGEVLRFTLTSITFNFLIIYLSDQEPLEDFDNYIVKCFDDAEAKLILGAKLPARPSLYKLSQLEYCTFVQWKEEVLFKDCMEKDYSLSQIIISYPHFDRMLTYLSRIFLNHNKNILIYGPKGCGKGTLIKRLIQHVNQINTKYKFVYLGCMDRLNLVKVQEQFNQFVETLTKNDVNKIVTIIIDNFLFTEHMISLMEMFIDQDLLIQGSGKPRRCLIPSRLKFIIICQDENEIGSIKKYDMFKDKFFILPMPKVDKNNLQQIVEYIYEWHLEVRSFSSEYQSLAEPFGKVLIKLFEGSEYILPGILKVVKGLLFAATESAPDLDSMTRLFVHELLRVLYDELPKESRKTKLLAKINNAISTYCHTSLETLFPKENDVQLGSNIDASGLQENHELNFYDKQAKSENLHIPSTFKIKELLFTEISNNHDVMEGIPYYPNFDLSDFIRHLSNLVFEFSRLQNLKKPINIVVTPKYAANIQKVMRVIRMSNEHVAIVGDCGVSSCVKLANFAVVGHIEHVYISTTTIEQFQASWMRGVARCTEYVVSTNLPVTLLFHFDESIFLIPTHWLLMLKQWFESYNVSEILSDDAILKLGEVIVDSEKGLATQAQANSIRLPGQRLCHFLPVEVLKNLKQLKKILSQRFSDFVHAVFLIPSGSENHFRWCTINFFEAMETKEVIKVLRKQLQDLPISQQTNEDKLVRVIVSMYEGVKELINSTYQSKHMFGGSANSRTYFYFAQKFVQTFNRKWANFEDKLNRYHLAISTLDLIKNLSQVGGDLSSETLAIELDDEELSFLMLSRELNRGKEKIVELERSLLTLEDENKKLVEESTNHSHLIKGIMDEPLAALESVNRILLAHPYENFRQLSFIKKPSVMIREVVDAVRMLLQKDYKPKKKSIDSWVCCQPFIRTKNLIDKLCNFDVNNVVDKQLLNVKRYTEFKLYKVNQMADESTLAADLCKWTMAIVAAIGANKHVQENKQIMSKLMSEAALLQSNILEKKNDLNKLKVKVKKLEDDTRTCEYEVTKLRKYLDYRVRGTKIVNCIMSIRSSWQQKHDIIKGMMDDLLGNTLIYAAFYTLSSHLGSDMKLRAMNGWKLIIAGNGIKYNDKFCDSDYFIKEALIETSWANAWPLICPEIQKKNTGTPRESQIEIIKNKILEFFPKAVVIDMKMSDGKHERKTSSDLRIDSSETTLAEMENRWLKRDVVDPTNGALRNGYQLIFLNIECSPPSEWMHLIEREMEQVVIVDRKRKDDTSGTIQPNQTQITLQFCGQTLVVNKSFKLFMVPSTEINLIERRLFRKVWPLTLNEGMDLQSGTNYPLDNEIVQHLSSQFEEAFILQKLNDYTANDILDSQDMTDQIIRNGTILLTNHARIY